MANTDHLNLPIVAASQAQKHVTVNESLLALDAIVMLSVKDKDLSAPPASPSAGDRYIVSSSPTGAWENQEKNLAVFQNGAWEFYTPQEGWVAHVEDEGVSYKYISDNWTIFHAAIALNGGATEIFAVEEELTSLSGSSVSTTATFPNQCIILGASVRVTEAITGAARFRLGTGGETSRFGSQLSTANGSTNQGTIGPSGNYAAQPVVITAEGGGNFTGGSVRITLHYIRLQPPRT